MHQPTYKRCRKCGRDRPATREHFYANARLKGGLHSECKECAVARSCAYSRRQVRRRRAERLTVLHEQAQVLADAVEPEAGAWIAGLIDGEGSFSIRKMQRGDYPCHFQLSLRVDDADVLAEIARETGLGWSTSHARSRMASWRVSSRRDALALTLMLERFPLRTQKRHDLALWSEAVRVWVALPGRGRSGGGSFAKDWSALAELRANLLAGRARRSARVA